MRLIHCRIIIEASLLVPCPRSAFRSKVAKRTQKKKKEGTAATGDPNTKCVFPFLLDTAMRLLLPVSPRQAGLLLLLAPACLCLPLHALWYLLAPACLCMHFGTCLHLHTHLHALARTCLRSRSVETNVFAAGCV